MYVCMCMREREGVGTSVTPEKVSWSINTLVCIIKKESLERKNVDSLILDGAVERCVEGEDR